jgi:hypothetical protein
MVGKAAPVPVRPDWFTAEELARYHHALASSSGPLVDDATWNDLELARYLALLGRRSSIFGRQVLFHRLRASASLPRGETAAFRLRAAQAATAAGDAGADPLQAVAAVLQPLRHVDTECAGALFDSRHTAAMPVWVRHLWAVQLGFVAAAGLLAAGAPVVAGLLLLGTLGVSARAQIALHPRLLQWQGQRRALLALAQSALAVARVPAAQGAAPHPLLRGVLAAQPAAHALLAAMGPRWSDRVPGLAEYTNLLALTQYRRCAQQRQELGVQRSAWQAVFTAVAGLEADLVVHAHLQFAQGTCLADVAPARSLVLQGLSHPLLQPAHPLDLALHGQGAFITGQNGAGKSTLLRSVGLNVVVGQALGFCYAQAAQVPALAVASSLQVEDALGTATSLYMAELQRARTLCAAAQAGGALCLVDEIFRGTNPQESVAATAALAHELAADGLLLLATHHRVLAPWLAASLRALCVERSADGVQSLRDGVLERTNGLAILADFGFSPATQAVAAQVFDWLQDHGGAQLAAGVAGGGLPTLQRAAPGLASVPAMQASEPGPA